jgi:hypothetical protein
MGWMKKSLLAATAAATAFASAPATARPHYGQGGYYGRSHGYSGAYASNHYYYGSRDWRRHHHRGGLSGGEAALLAAGIIGGIILIDRATENDRYRGGDGYEGRPYDDRYRRDDGYDRYPRDGSYRRDDRRYGDLDDRLEGGRARPGDYNYGAAYNDCKAETRDAARDSGVTVALPSKPDRIIPIDGGGAVRFEARYTASDGRGERRRRMVCEADEGGVTYLQLV